jgi:hypothetical protein
MTEDLFWRGAKWAKKRKHLYTSETRGKQKRAEKTLARTGNLLRGGKRKLARSALAARAVWRRSLAGRRFSGAPDSIFLAFPRTFLYGGNFFASPGVKLFSEWKIKKL